MAGLFYLLMIKSLPRPIAGGPVFRTSDGAPLEPYGMTLRFAALAPDHLRDGADVMDRLASKAVDPGGLPVNAGGLSEGLRPPRGQSSQASPIPS
jgi:hypothetical protein